MTDPSDPLSLASATQIDALCDQFEAAWRAGQPHRIEDLLVPLPPGEFETALAALLRVELELRQRSGERPQATDYQARFVHQVLTVTAVFDELARQPTTDTSVAQAQTRTISVGHDQTAAATSDEPQPAAIGRFIVVSKLGEGAFGMVYRARDPQLDREVAIKVPRAGTLTSPTDIERFLREAKAAATMQHPNICPVYEVGTANGRPYIVMALVPGKSLAEHIQERKVPFPARQTALIIRKLAQSLELAHQKGIIHRDLKPANILIDQDRKDVVVMDFGLARREERDAAQLTQSGVLMGTPAYMSPEQARGDQAAIGPTSDIYSLGVILYELLAGERPFTGSMAEVLGKILHVDPPPPSAVRKGVDPRLETICMRAMARKPADRYSSMRALAEALGGWLKSSPHAPPEESVSRSETPTEESPQPRVDEMFTALSADLKAEAADRQAKTEAAVEAAARKARIPLWQLLSAAVLFAGLVAAGIIFFARTPTTTVVINIENIDLKDAALSFNLDGKDVAGAALEKPIELKVGTHELLVYREKSLIHKYMFTVSMDAGPRIELKEELPMPPKPAQPPQFASPTLVADGFIPFFSEQNLTGWEGLPDHWTVTDGNLIGKPRVSGTGNHYLVSKRPYRDFELKVDVLLGDGENGGIQIRTRATGTGEQDLAGPQVDMGKNVWGGVWGEGMMTGWMLKADEAVVNGALKPGEFNQVHVRAFGKRVTIRLNGITTVDGEVPDIDDEGVLAFQVHRSNKHDVAYRNARLKDLTSPTDRAAAESVLQIGGQVGIMVDGTEKKLNNFAELPPAAFKLSSIVLQGKPVNDSDLSRLKGLRDLEGLNLDHTNVTDAGLEHLHGLPNLRHLHFVGMPITDAGLARLADMKLTILNLTGTQITDDGLAHLSAMTSLSYIWLGDTKTTDEGVKHLRQLSNLIELGLGNTKVTDQGLAHLKGLRNLSWLFLNGTQIGDAGLEHLAGKNLGLLDLRDTTVSDAGVQRLHGMQTLGILWLSGTGITDRGLETVSQFKALRELHLDRTKVTDDGLVHLQGLKELGNLGLIGTQVTDASIAELKAALPNCQITR